MKTFLNWKRGIFSNTYRIFSDNSQVGKLKEKAWTQSADGELNGKKYSFKTKGLFKQETQIIDSESGSLIGKITYNSWKTKARIEYSGKVVNWKYNNAWNTKWSLFNSEGIHIHYHGSSIKGNMESDNQNDMLALAGLYITNYYWEMSIPIIIAVFIPIWLTVLN